MTVKGYFKVAGECGDCSMCCKVMAIPELGKADGEWCKHICKNHKGCGIYETRPAVCRDFLCLWRRDAAAPLSMRPDKCGVVFGGGTRPDIISAYVDPGRPDAWKKPEVWKMIETLVRRGGYNVVVTTRDPLKRIIFYMEGGMMLRVDKHFTPPDKEGVQWVIHDPRHDKVQPVWGPPK